MARTGIYVGGHEIIKRYVGEKKVWQKWRILQKFSDATRPIISPLRKTRVRILIKTSNLDNINYADFNIAQSKIRVINRSDDVEEVFYSIGVRFLFGGTGSSNVRTNGITFSSLDIEFNTPEEASNFKNRFHSGTIEIYI